MVSLLKNTCTYKDFTGTIPTGFNQNVTNAFCWTKAGGVKLDGLVKRRNAEMTVFCKNQKYSFVKIV